MPRLQAVDPQQASGKAKELLEAVKAKLGRAPNLFRTFANSPAVLDAYLGFNGALAGGALSARVREQIALAVAEANRCEYCLAAHSAIGKTVGLREEEIRDSRRGDSRDSKTAAALQLARAIVETRGVIADHDVQQARNAGLTDGEIAEVVANVALNIFTNYFNHVAATEVDFPKVALTQAA